MFARVTRGQIPTDKIEEVSRAFNEMVVPRAREQQQQGLEHAYWLIDRQSGQLLGIGLWATQEQLQASEAAFRAGVAETQRALGLESQEPTIEVYEVLAHV